METNPGTDHPHLATGEPKNAWRNALLEQYDPTTLRAYWAYWTLMTLDGLIVGNAPDAIEMFLDLALCRLG